MGGSALLALRVTVGLGITLVVTGTTAMAAGGTLVASHRERRRGVGYSVGGAALSSLGGLLGPLGLGIVMMLAGGFLMGRPLLRRVLSH
jgi:hypothetical protein